MSRKRTRNIEAMTTTTTVSPFPLAIIINILSRLPVKYIVRFKCVSKSWSALIKSPAFITAHLNRSAENPSLIIRYYNHVSGNDPGLIFLRSGRRQHDVEMPFLEGLSCFPKVIGSCNGLLCLDVSSCFCSAFMLWNPGTNEFKRLPKPLLNERHLFQRFWMVSLGFGFNQVNNEYVLVRIINFEIHEAKVEVYKTSTRNWKEIAENPGSCVIYAGQDAVAVNGVFHWMANGIGDLANIKFVVSFDMNQEVFWRTVMPEIPPEHYVKAVSYNESLALAVYPGYRSRTNGFELWVMKEGKNWTKQLDIRLHRAIHPVGSWKGSEIIMKRGHEFFLFDPITRNTVYLPINGSGYTYKVYMYVDSLVDVDGNGENELVEAEVADMVEVDDESVEIC